jgi:hypothetical protein
LAGAVNAGYAFVSLSNGTGFPAWTWSTSSRLLDDNAKVWLADVDGDAKADLVAQGAPEQASAGMIYAAFSDGTGYPAWTWSSVRKVVGN